MAARPKISRGVFSKNFRPGGVYQKYPPPTPYSRCLEISEAKWNFGITPLVKIFQNFPEKIEKYSIIYVKLTGFTLI